MIETRTYNVRAQPAGGAQVVSGHAALFDALSFDMGGWRERIARGAFRKSLAGTDYDIVALWSHDPSKPLASRRNGTLTLAEDSVGLAFEMRLTSPASWVRDAFVAIESSLVAEMSFGFRIPDGGDTWKKEGDTIVRTIMEAELFEISPVAMPAYPNTTVSPRPAPAAAQRFTAPRPTLQPLLATPDERRRQARFNFAVVRNDARRRVIDRMNSEVMRG